MPQRRFATFTIFVLVALGAGASASEPTTWTSIETEGPLARNLASVAYDAARGVTVLFGGCCAGGSLPDTWEWDGREWTLRAITGPTPRELTAMAYDSQRERTVLFGGWDKDRRLDDTWEWDGVEWTRVAEGGPLARFRHALAYDSSRGVAVLFGGHAPFGRLGDTWEWDGVAWERVATQGPSPRAGHALAFDASRGVVVLFGGRDADGLSDETWEWDGTAWQQADAFGPPPRFSSHGLVYDSRRERVILFGGRSPHYDDTWEWDGVAWEERIPTVRPRARSGHAVAYDSGRGVAVLFGGFDGPRLDDTWEYGLDADVDSIVDLRDNCPERLNPHQVDDDRDRIGNACDPVFDTLVLQLDPTIEAAHHGAEIEFGMRLVNNDAAPLPARFELSVVRPDGEVAAISEVGECLPGNPVDYTVPAGTELDRPCRFTFAPVGGAGSYRVQLRIERDSGDLLAEDGFDLTLLP